MSGGIVEIANAKINLSLRVLGKRADGYHQLESLVMFADAADRVICEPAEHLSLEIAGPFAEALGWDEDNLVLQAARILAVALEREPAVAFTLEKYLPVASGIGGGSADAAAALRGMMSLWKEEPAQIAKIALRLGADVPVCLANEPSFMSGIGEQVQPVSGLPDLHAVLVNPGEAVPTARVFERLNAGPAEGQQGQPFPPDVRSADALFAWLDEHGNDLEAPAIEVAPVIARVLAVLGESRGCHLARMSGSGATCFGLFDMAADAAEAAVAISADKPDWWVRATRLLGAQ